MNTNRKLFRQEMIKLEDNLLEELNCCIPNLNEKININLWIGTSINLHGGILNIDSNLKITTTINKDKPLTIDQDIEFTEMRLQILKNWDMIKSLFQVYDKKYDELREKFL